MTDSRTVEISTPSDREVVVTREFDAPRHLVFDAFTRPDLLQQWYGQTGWSLVVCDVDLRVGGTFRFVSRRPEGKDVGQRGIYREVVAPERLVYAESWEGWDPGETIVTLVLEDRDGKTRFTSTAVFPTKAVRDIVLEAGMQRGANELYDRLAGCLAALV